MGVARYSRNYTGWTTTTKTDRHSCRGLPFGDGLIKTLLFDVDLFLSLLTWNHRITTFWRCICSLLKTIYSLIRYHYALSLNSLSPCRTEMTVSSVSPNPLFRSPQSPPSPPPSLTCPQPSRTTLGRRPPHSKSGKPPPPLPSSPPGGRREAGSGWQLAWGKTSRKTWPGWTRKYSWNPLPGAECRM